MIKDNKIIGLCHYDYQTRDLYGKFIVYFPNQGEDFIPSEYTRDTIIDLKKYKIQFEGTFDLRQKVIGEFAEYRENKSYKFRGDITTNRSYTRFISPNLCYDRILLNKPQEDNSESQEDNSEFQEVFSYMYSPGIGINTGSIDSIIFNTTPKARNKDNLTIFLVLLFFIILT